MIFSGKKIMLGFFFVVFLLNHVHVGSFLWHLSVFGECWWVFALHIHTFLSFINVTSNFDAEWQVMKQ